MNAQLNVPVVKTRQPSLTRAVIRQLGGMDENLPGTLEDIARHSADAGWCGFTYYTETVKFFRYNRGGIMERAKEDAQSFGVGLFEMIAGFGCLKDKKLSHEEIAEALYSYSNRGEMCDIIQNAMAWCALEEVARELNPDL